MEQPGFEHGTSRTPIWNATIVLPKRCNKLFWFWAISLNKRALSLHLFFALFTRARATQFFLPSLYAYTLRAIFSPCRIGPYRLGARRIGTHRIGSCCTKPYATLP